MQTSLGIYIEENIIKYAKVSKEREEYKVEAFGIRFFQNLSEELNKLIEETYSFNTPISINLANEKYLYFDIFALLNKKDIEKTITTEFETFCEEKKYNTDAFETRHAIMPNKDDKEKLRALNIYVNKIEYNNQIMPFEKFRLEKTMPISIAIANIARLEKNENQVIVNIEGSTTVTTIYDNQIYSVDTIEVGSKEVLDNINRLENSYATAYDICKNTTIYTAESEDLGEEQPYLQFIMPTIYKIAEEVQKIIATDENMKIHTIYLTGTLATINNVDLYFQEFFPDIECKILKPNIVDEAVTKINIKEYVEVNSAIALAKVGLGEGIEELNFKKTKASEKFKKMFTLELPNGKKLGPKNVNISFDGFKAALDGTEIWLVRSLLAVVLVLLIYILFSKVLSDKMVKKEEEIKGLISQENSQIAKVNSDTSSLDAKTSKYRELIAELKKVNEKISDVAARRNSIPNLLQQIMSRIPERVQLTSIENTIDRTIVITANSYDYDQLGYFIATLRAQKILNNVISSSGVKSDGIISVTIEGELP